MAWTSFPTWIVGQVSLASDWNTYVAANMSFLATPPLCKVYRNTALNATASAYTIMPYDTVIVDTVSGFSVGSSLYTVAVAGSYLVALRHGSANAIRCQAATGHNSSVYSAGSDGISSATVVGSTVSDIVSGVSVGDTLEGYYYFGAADAVEVGIAAPGGYQCWMTILKVSN